MKARLSILIVTLLLILPSRVSGIGPDTIFSDLQKIMERVADWQINNFTYQKTGNLHDYGIDAWTNAVLYAGMLKWVQTTEVPSTYLDWLMKIGEENEWSVPANFADYPKYQYYHADELCIGQFYLGMYDRYKKDAMLHAVQERVDWIMNHPADTSMRYSNKQCWTWCDALFMAPPVYVHLARITERPAISSLCILIFANLSSFV
ncbi:MAG: glycoside hydrolase family 88 protein [Phocaeicola vulgatus]